MAGETTRRRTTAYSRLRDMADTIHADCAAMTAPQLRSLLKRIDGLTGTNCAWDVYRLRHVVRDIARGHLESRAYRGRKAGAAKRAGRRS